MVGADWLLLTVSAAFCGLFSSIWLSLLRLMVVVVFRLACGLRQHERLSGRNRFAVPMLAQRPTAIIPHCQEAVEAVLKGVKGVKGGRAMRDKTIL